MQKYYIENKNFELQKYGIEFFSVTPMQSGTIVKPHIHPSLEFIYVKSGIFEISVDNVHTFTAHEGDMLIFRANTIHTILNASEERSLYYVLKVSPTIVFNTFACEDQGKYAFPFLQKRKDDVICILGSDMADELVRLWREMIYEYEHRSDSFYLAQRINASRLLLYLLRSRLAPRASEAPASEISERSVEQIYGVVDFINNNFSSDITPIDCAEMLHISYGYFAKLFKAVVGKTFKEYLCDVRMSHAHNLLTSSNDSVTEIASMCGYDNLSYFVAEYKKTFGKTPKAVQKEANYKRLGD